MRRWVSFVYVCVCVRALCMSANIYMCGITTMPRKLSKGMSRRIHTIIRPDDSVSRNAVEGERYLQFGKSKNVYKFNQY